MIKSTIPLDLLEELESKYLNPRPSLDWTTPRIWREFGRSSLVEDLRLEYERQQKESII